MMTPRLVLVAILLLLLGGASGQAAPGGKPASRPASRPTSQPASKPTTQPAKKPAGDDGELTIEPDASIDPAAAGRTKVKGGKGAGKAKATAASRANGASNSAKDASGKGKASRASTRASGAGGAGSDDYRLRTVSIIGRLRDRARIAGSAHVVRERDLERFEYNDVQRALESNVPGVYVRGEDGFGLRPNIGLRGASSDRSAKVTLLEDGVLLGPAPYSAPAAYYFPMVTRLVGIEVFKGPAAVKHGPNTIGGAINLLTARIPRRRRASIDLSYGRFRLAKVHGRAGQSWGPLGIVVEGVHLSTDGFKRLDGGGDTGFAKNEVMLKARWHSDPAAAIYHQVDFKAGYSDETSHETYLGLTDDDFGRDGLRRYLASGKGEMTWWRTQLRLDYFVSGQRFDVALTAYRHDFHRQWYKLNAIFENGTRRDGLGEILRNPGGTNAVTLAVLRGEQDSADVGINLGVGENDRRFVSQGLQLLSHVRLPKLWRIRQTVEVGLRLHHDSIERDHTEDTFLMQTRALVPSGDARATLLRNEASTVAFAGYLLDEIRIGDLLLTPGLRIEHIRRSYQETTPTTRSQDGSSTVVVPGVGAFYQLRPWIGLLAGVHRGFSPVAPGQPDDVEPETSVNVEWGARLASKQTKTRAELIGFFNRYSNITGTCTFSSGCGDSAIGAQYNGGAVDVGGLEALARQRFDLPGALRLALRASYTLTLSSFRTSFRSGFPQFGDVQQGDSLPYVPEHQLAVGFELSRKRWALAMGGVYVGEMRDIAGQGDITANERVPARFVLDLAAVFFLTKRARIYATVNNLLDNRYIISRRPFGARPGQPLTVQLGIKYSVGR